MCWTWGNEEPPTADIPKDRAHMVGGEPIRMDKLVPMHRWEAGDRGQAAQYYKTLLVRGIPHSEGTRRALEPTRIPNQVWRYRGAPYYLEQQMDRMRLTAQVTKRAHHSREFHQVSHLLGELSERLVKMVSNGHVDLNIKEAEAISAVLEQCDEHVAQLCMVAAAAAQAVDEARMAYGLPLRHRVVNVLCEYDVPVPSEETEQQPLSPHKSKKGERVS
jgi:hypothetical protein